MMKKSFRINKLNFVLKNEIMGIDGVSGSAKQQF